MNQLEASIDILRPRPYGLREAICAECGGIGRNAVCGVCQATPASAPPRDQEHWTAGGYRFLLAATSAVAGARSYREPHFERRFLDLAIDPRIPAPSSIPASVREAACGPAPSSPAPTCALVLSWILGRLAALAGAKTLPRSLTYGDDPEACGDYVIDLLAAKSRKLVAGLCIIGAPDRLMLVVDDLAPSDAADALVASLRDAPHALVPISVRVRSRAFVRDPDCYRTVPPENTYGVEGHQLLGADNAIYSTHRRPPPDPVTSDVVLRVFDRTGDAGGFALALVAAHRPRRNTAALVECALARSDLHPLRSLAIEREDPVTGYTQVARAIAQHAPELERCTFGAEGGFAHYGPPDESDDVPADAPRSALGFVQLEGDAHLPLDLSHLSFPSLRELVLRRIGKISWQGVGLEQLARLELRGLTDLREALAALARVPLPRLTELVIDADPADAILPLLDAALPSLVNIEVRGVIGTSLLDRLASPPWAAQLRRLVVAGEAEPGLVASRADRFTAIGELRTGGVDLTPSHAQFGTGKVVQHAKFGKGKVVREISGAELKLEIEFETGDRKILLARFVQDASA